ncbi:MAG: hypothetical protein JRG73_11760 [Deltaproteobacteria bacterium]|nr:hypothetical protein [Deltaproteobacteria bacterium]
MLDLPLRIGLVLMARCCLNTAKARGWLPWRLYLRTIIALLRKDDLDGAVSTFVKLYRRRALTKEGLVIRDVIRAEIDVRRQILSSRRDQLRAKEQQSLQPIRRFIRRCLNPRSILTDSHRIVQSGDEQKALEEGLLILERKMALLESLPAKDEAQPIRASCPLPPA